jgi:phosphate uptake regulator
METQEQTKVLSFEEVMERVERNVDDSYTSLLRTLTDNSNLKPDEKESLIKLLLIMNQIQLALNPEGSDSQCQ